MNSFEAYFTLTEEKAKIMADSLRLESRVLAHERSKTTVSVEGNKLKIEIQSEDLHALRAGVNTYLKWIIMSQQLLD